MSATITLDNVTSCSTDTWAPGSILGTTVLVSVQLRNNSLSFHQAVKLTSSRTQLPYEYYSLPFCQPRKITYKAENLGKFLSHITSACTIGESSVIFLMLIPLSSLCYYTRHLCITYVPVNLFHPYSGHGRVVAVYFSILQIKCFAFGCVIS